MLGVVALAGVAAAASVRPENLRCEFRVNPLGIDVAKPRLSWVLTETAAGARGLKQSAYRVIVASTGEALRAGLGDLWDTGRVASDQSLDVEFDGKPLESGRQAFWKVRVWDQAGAASEWSAAARWSAGLLKPGDWKGKWIGQEETAIQRRKDSPYWDLADSHFIWQGAADAARSAPEGDRFFRTRFTMPSGVKRVTAIVGADNEFELFVNGKHAGAGRYVKLPEVIDVTQYVRASGNTLAIRARNARGGKPAGLIAAVRMEAPPAKPGLIWSGPSWRAAARRQEGWEQPSFDDSNWESARDLGGYGVAPWGEVGFSEERYLPARMLRKEFDAHAGIRRATVYASGLGLFELYVNGVKAGDHVLSPGLTEYDKRVLYVTHDVTRLVQTGPNAIGAILGNGRYFAPRLNEPIFTRTYGYPKLMAQLEIEYADGSVDRVVSDESWKISAAGPVRGNNEFDGEEYDARLEQPGWAKPGFAAAGWKPAQAGALAAQMAEPIRVTETLHPVKMTALKPGVYVFDMGQNMVGWCRLRVSGPKGATVTLRHSETLKPDGSLYVDNLRSARAEDQYTLKGGVDETWEPRFTYHGFRYVEVSGYPGKPSTASLEGRVVHDALEKTADFESSSAILNQIHRNAFWGVRGNYRSIPTDCPQRDERQGWLGDRSQVSRSETYLFDVAAFYSKWVTDIGDAQRDTGSVPDVAPAYWVMYNNNVTWPSTFVLAPGVMYEQYGDKRILERNYPSMKKWMDFMRGFLMDDLMPKDTYGDWCVPPESPELIHSQDPRLKTDGTLIGTAYFESLCRRMAWYARIIGEPADSDDFEQLAGRMRAAFHRKFFDASAGHYGNGTQTSSVLPLAFDIAPPQDRARLFDSLVRKIDGESRGHVGTGLVGAQWLLRVLSDSGRTDLAYKIASQTGYPGWGYMIQKGATTIWELWNGDTADPAMNSGNHVMQIGDLVTWLYEYLAGIRGDPEQPGFRHIVLRPHAIADLAYVKASHRSRYGLVASHWRRQGDRLEWTVKVPPNTSATVHVPARDANSVTESGKPAGEAAGVKFVNFDAGAAVFEIGSGEYRFASAR